MLLITSPLGNHNTEGIVFLPTWNTVDRADIGQNPDDDIKELNQLGASNIPCFSFVHTKVNKEC